VSPGLRRWARPCVLAAVLAVALPVGAWSAEPASATDISVGHVIDDALISTRVTAALLADPLINRFDFKVSTRKGVVLLSGFVDDQGQLDRATTAVRGVAGVSSLLNRVLLKGAAASVGNTVDDGIATGKIRAALLGDPGIKSLEIAVVTRLDVVQLSGFVDTAVQMERALAIAAAVPGVRSVDNAMQLKQ
jgi:hyperosmotically inducible protein